MQLFFFCSLSYPLDDPHPCRCAIDAQADGIGRLTDTSGPRECLDVADGLSAAHSLIRVRDL